VVDGALPIRIELWDGSALGPTDGPGTVVVRSPDAVRRLLWSPGELGLARAFVAGDIEIEGDIFAMINALEGLARRRGGAPEGNQGDARRHARRANVRAMASALRAARRLGALGPPLTVPDEEARFVGRRHTPRSDARAISHHYDIGNGFYRMVLGPSMTYSCARFAEPTMTLEEAQRSKHEIICRKLGLHERPEMRLLDVGCGWASMALHAAGQHGAHAVGITLSAEQVEYARRRVDEAGLGDRVEIRLQDYRDLRGEQFDAISSVGMFEHVGKARIEQYFSTLHGLLAPAGRLLNHAISRAGMSTLGRRSFMGRYVFPDGELLDVGDVVIAMQQAGFEVRDVESLREHYSKTLHAWVDNLERHWEDAVAEVGAARARVWRLYMAGSANRFDDGRLGVHQVLGVVPGTAGVSAMPPTRAGWI
jgi:cyclopropane-fatty-acyl-phospholipid synthase